MASICLTDIALNHVANVTFYPMVDFSQFSYSEPKRTSQLDLNYLVTSTVLSGMKIGIHLISIITIKMGVQRPKFAS